jgi:hypothetical protein
MCFDIKTSLLTFLLGSFFCIILYKSSSNVTIKVLSISWVFIILMQLFEAIIWFSKENKKPDLDKITSYLVFILNLLQPLILLFLLTFIIQDKQRKILLISIIIIYSIIIIQKISSFSLNKTLYHDIENCPHLDYYWWKDFKVGNYAYFISFISALLLIKPLSLGISIIIYLLISLYITSKIYCRISSVWCWSAAFGPLFTLLIIKLRIVNL